MTARRAFTLVELLMAVAIVSLLAGLLVPALASAGRWGEAAACQSNLRALGSGLSLYGFQHGGSLPPGPIERAQWPGDPDRGSPYELYDARRPGERLSSRQGWYGMGLLWKAGCVENGASFYCRAGEKPPENLQFAHAWPQNLDAQRNPLDGKTRIYGSYAYRGGLASRAGTPLGPLNLHRHSGRLGVLSDNPCSGRMWHRGGYYIATLDGAVGFHAFDAPPVPDGRLQDLWSALPQPR